jgi:uncharacterized Zn-binding protein involved in type VI secretion
MGQPAAKKGDRVTAIDIHIVFVPGPPPTWPALPHPFNGVLSDSLSPNVKVMGQPAATVGSTADNSPPHFPTPPGTAFQRPPANRGTVAAGSPTVLVNRKPMARNGDAVITCNDPADLRVGTVVASPAGTVLVG